MPIVTAQRKDMQRRFSSTIVVLMVLASPGPAVAKSRVDCRGVTKQSACVGQEICIDDPIRLPGNTRFSLFPATMTYSTTATKGRIATIAPIEGGGRTFVVYPPIFESRAIELSGDGATAKGIGSLYNYYFKCEKEGR